jgi:Bacterial membrane protein YfhO
LRPRISSILQRRIRPPKLWKGERGALLGLAALAFCLFPDAVFRGRVFYLRDIHLQWYGQIESFVRSVGSRSLPFWDLYTSFGQPLLANANNQLLYPLTWLNLFMRPWTYFTIYVLMHSLFSGIGLYSLCRRLGISRLGSWLAAATWMTSGPLLSLVTLWNHLAAAAWIPWAFLAGDRALAYCRPVDALLWGGCLAAQILCGSPDMFAMTSLLLSGYAMRFLQWRDPWHSRNLRLLAIAALAWTFAFGLSAAQWIPSLDLVRQSGRSSFPVEIRTAWSLHPLNLLQTVIPLAGDDPLIPAEYRAALFEGREPLLSSIYLGMPAVGLAAAALAGRRRALAGFFAIAAAGGSLVAMGRHWVAYDFAVTVLPPLKILRFPSKAVIVTAFGWAVLAGLGVDSWRERAKAAGPGWRICVVVPLAAVVGLAISILLVSGNRGGLDLALTASARRLALSTGLTVATLLLACWREGGAAAGRLKLLPAALVLIDLFVTNRGLNPTAPRELFAFRPPVVSAVKQEDGRRLYVYDYLAAPGLSRRHLGRDAPYEMLLPPHAFEWAEALGMRSYLSRPLTGGNGLYSSYDADVLGIQPRPLTLLTDLLIRAEGTPLHLRLLRMGAVSYVAALHSAGLEALVPVGTFPSLFREPIRLFRVPDPLPRTYVVSGARVADGPAALNVIADPAFDPTREIVLPDGASTAPSSTFAGSSRLLWIRSDRVRLEARLSSPGYVVLVDAYSPGWRATVDGRETPVLRANMAFRAIPVGAGSHLVDCVYRPWTITTGLAISGASVVLVAAGALAMLVWRRPDGTEAGPQGGPTQGG